VAAGTAPDESVLSTEERARLARIVHPPTRRAQARSFVMRREVIGVIGGVAPREVAFRRHCATCGSDDHGRPEVAAPAIEAVRSISVSHTTAFVGLATATIGVGLDIEGDRPAGEWDEIAAYTTHPDDAVDGSLERWTAKEAVLKLLGSGLGRSMSDVCVQGDGWRMDATGPDAVAGRVRWVRIADGTLAALATHADAAVTVERWR
jgi:4'-phosphopantetheinyl transferase